MTQVTPILFIIWLFEVSMRSPILQTVYGTLMSYGNCVIHYHMTQITPISHI